jgi:hypothetical protein
MLAMSNSEERDEDVWKAMLKAVYLNCIFNDVRRILGVKLDFLVVRDLD